jgi:hypothetical protein
MAKTKIKQEILDQWEAGHKREVLAVKALGEKIGYGNMMSIASALWQLDLKDRHNLDIGAFIPTITLNMKKKEGEKAIEEQKRRAEYFKKMLKNEL